jgi:cytochrome c-type biogenesis protein CcmH/NrfF
MGALVGMSGGFILGLVGAFVLGPIWMIASEGNEPPPVNLLTLTLLLTIPTGLIIGIMVPIREASRRRKEAKVEEEEEARSHRS